MHEAQGVGPPDFLSEIAASIDGIVENLETPESRVFDIAYGAELLIRKGGELYRIPFPGDLNPYKDVLVGKQVSYTLSGTLRHGCEGGRYDLFANLIVAESELRFEEMDQIYDLAGKLLEMKFRTPNHRAASKESQAPEEPKE